MDLAGFYFFSYVDLADEVMVMKIETVFTFY